MQKQDDYLRFSPSDLCRFLESSYVSWMDRAHLESPGRFLPDPVSETDKLLQERGIDHERTFLSTLQTQGRDVCVISESGNRFENTAEAMRAGQEIIYQAALRDNEFIGFADFLFLVGQSGEEGKNIYEPWDTKLAFHAKPYYLIQLACYADLLREHQGVLPNRIHLVLGNNETRSYRTEDFFYQYRQVRRSFLEQQGLFNPEEAPDFSGLEDFGRWTSEAEKRMLELDHLCRVANMRRVQIKKLYSSGVHTMTQLAAHESSVPGMKEATIATLRQQAQLQIASSGAHIPKYKLIPLAEGKGLTKLPPFSELDVYFDMEGYPFADGGLEYLFGATTVEAGIITFTDWWAHNPEEEKLALENFIDWAHARWLTDPAMHIYHYAAYEKTALRRLMGKYGTREAELDALLRNEVFVDLLPIVRQSIQVGEPNYSIKSIEKLYREKRHGDVATAIDSVVFYKKWLDSKDSAGWQNSTILADIRSYNKEDCDSTFQLAEWLRNVQKEQDISFQIPPTKVESESSAAQSRNNASILARRMLEDLPVIPENQSDRQRMQILLAELLEFHWREAKPVFWAKYDRHAMTEEELFEDSCCLASLKRLDTRPRLSHSRRSILYDYEFDAKQDSKIDVGVNCFYAHDLEETISIDSLDMQNGKITLKRSREKPAPPALLSLILDEFVDASALADSIYTIAESFFNGSELPSALQDFLLRRRPRIHGGESGALVDGERELADSVVDVISRMEDTTLCIQGPPGSGKTFTAAKAIASLIRSGRRVGVTSNSHKAIAKLIDEVASLMGEQREIRIAKIQSDERNFEVKGKRVYKLEPKAYFDKGTGMFSLVGGTAWFFSDSQADGLFDFLFVDEAGQVSMANLVAMSRAARNIVLIGDQMQLSQPLKGTHPGTSCKSVLEYLLDEANVVAKDFGIFLETTRRLHPSLCSFISGAVYQDRLLSHPSTESRILQLPEGDLKYLSRSTGLLFIPVEHEGNTQDSEEEAAAVAEVVKELLRCSLTSKEGKRSLAIGDVLVVAPYNMQVRRLRSCLPGYQIGTVDKFQGQEAPVVILSMSASSGEGLARGIEFLFSKNRLNVAISRAQLLAIVVGSPALATVRCSNVEQMELVNLYCRIIETGNQFSMLQI